ncbi:MAG: hypothetical protein DMF90_08815 [Acidobacteria bacterium]|nr:MAG: hypothetical protein DMF90_08815 [Acidobacteriota bacterium]
MIALGAYVIIFLAIKLVILGPGHPIRLNPPNGLAALIIAPVSMTLFYFVAVFSYGLSGDVAARQSIYPSRMFTMPVTTRALAGWPMLYGTSAAASLWIATAILVRWSGGADVYVPWVWPALLSAACLAWTQALMWMPYGLPGMRVVIAALWLAVVDAIVLLALNYKASELVMVAVCAPQIPFAYLVAWYAVGRARRGDNPDWRGLFAPRKTIASGFSRIEPRFLSPARAQTWFEWRRHGRTLPAMVAVVVPFELLLLFVPGNDTAPIVFLILFVVLFTPPFMAAFAAAALSTPTPFTARRPLTSAALIAAKLRMTVWSTIAAWLLAVTFSVVALLLSGRMPVVVERARAGIEVTGTLRGVAVVLFVFAAFFASTWKHLVQSLCVGLTGSEWLIKSSVLLALIALVAAGPLADGIIRSRIVQSAIWDSLPWILVVLVVLKMIAGSWVAIRLYDSRLLSDRALVSGAACWLATVLALFGVLEWFAASPLVPRYFLGAIAILQVPLARVSAAPVAIAWSRHR